jgi:hypothetical protein
MSRYKRLFFWLISLGIFALLGWAYYPVIFIDSTLSFKWEGLIPAKTNFRDAGKSVNECLAGKLLPEGRLYRSNEFFSGWDCSTVGNPDTILSLNTFDANRETFYCRSGGFVKGESYQAVEMSDLEFLETWDTRPDFVRATCQHVHRALLDVKSNKKVLVHCEAGRDRTGAVTALIVARLLEEGGLTLDNRLIDAIECDYRKSKSIKEYKHGRIKEFLNAIKLRYGSVKAFLEEKCRGV